MSEALVLALAADPELAKAKSVRAKKSAGFKA